MSILPGHGQLILEGAGRPPTPSVRQFKMEPRAPATDAHLLVGVPLPGLRRHLGIIPRYQKLMDAFGSETFPS